MIVATVIAILLLFGLSGGPFEPLLPEYAEDPIEATIDDEDRREQALDALDSVGEAVEDFYEGVAEDIEALDDLVRDYDSKPEDFERLFDSAMARRRHQVGRIWTKRSALLRHITAEEWPVIVRSARAAAEADEDS